MIADLKPYAASKDSAQSWLGAVPEHWAVVPNRALFEEVKDRNHPDEDMLSVTITKGIVLNAYRSNELMLSPVRLRRLTTCSTGRERDRTRSAGTRAR